MAEIINIEDLMTGEKQFSDAAIVRNYVTLKEKVLIGQSIAEVVFESGSYDVEAHLLLRLLTSVVSYTNIKIDKYSLEVYDFLMQNQDILDLLPIDEIDYQNIVDRCVEEKRFELSLDKAIRDNVNKLSKTTNRLLKAATKIVEETDGTKIGERIGEACQTVAKKLPDFSNSESMEKIIGAIKFLKGK